MNIRRAGRNAVLLAAVLCGITGASGGPVVFAQLRYAGSWDPYPGVFADIAAVLTMTTSVNPSPERRVLDAESPEFRVRLAETPFLIVLGSDEFAVPSRAVAALRDWLLAGGTLFVDDVSERERSRFDMSFRSLMREMFPEYKLRRTTQESVIMKSFYLLRRVAGRVAVRDYVEYLEYEGRPAVIYSRNNMVACWARDRFGAFLYPCIPDGEPQRFVSQRLFLNVLMYSLCGTYKLDAVHQPFIERRLRMRTW